MITKNVEKKEKNTATFQVESDAAEFEAAVNGAYLKNRASIYIPGFRKGKTPRAVVEGMYGPEVFYQDAMDDLAPKAFDFGLKESELRMVGAPSIIDVEVTEGRTVLYTFGISLYPEVTLGEYKGLTAEKTVEKVSDDEVQKELEEARKRNARMITVDDRAAKLGDVANIDFDGYLDGERFDGGKAEEYSLELGSNSFVPGFEDQVVGMTIGEEKDVNITFPEQYVEELAGKDVVFKVKLNGLTYAEMPELDDEFAKDVSEFDTLDEYKQDLRSGIEKRYQEQADNKFKGDVLRAACDNMTVDIPEVMIEDKVEEILRNYAANFGISDSSITMDKLKEMLGVTDEAMANNIRPAAELQVKTDLLLDAVAKAENIQITDEDAEEYLKKVAENVGATPDQLREYFGKDFIAQEQMKEKATNLIVDSAVSKKAGKAKAKKETKIETAPAEEKAEEPVKKPRAKKAAKAEEAPAEEKAEEPVKKPRAKKAAKTEESSEEK